MQLLGGRKSKFKVEGGRPVRHVSRDLLGSERCEYQHDSLMEKHKLHSVNRFSGLKRYHIITRSYPIKRRSRSERIKQASFNDRNTAKRSRLDP